ncbi:Concanavalin A-like lectin/glucanase domain [Phytophthora cactorum]|nr:Concanavalin A-like lectin/glucanase domain [Phytophthora cactorum]
MRLRVVYTVTSYSHQSLIPYNRTPPRRRPPLMCLSKRDLNQNQRHRTFRFAAFDLPDEMVALVAKCACSAATAGEYALALDVAAMLQFSTRAMCIATCQLAAALCLLRLPIDDRCSPTAVACHFHSAICPAALKRFTTSSKATDDEGISRWCHHCCHLRGCLRQEYCGQWDWARARSTPCTTTCGTKRRSVGQPVYGCRQDQWLHHRLAHLYTWTGGAATEVKSYSNAALIFTPSRSRISRLSATKMKYSYSHTSGTFVADVSYDLFTSSTAGGSNEYEDHDLAGRLWRCWSISSTGKAIATVTIAATASKCTRARMAAPLSSRSWQPKPSPTSRPTAEVLIYLVNKQGLPSSQFLITLEAGTEPFVGTNAKMTVSSYSAAVN